MVHPQLLIYCPLFEIKALHGYNSKHEPSVVLGMLLIPKNCQVLQKPEIPLGHCLVEHEKFPPNHTDRYLSEYILEGILLLNLPRMHCPVPEMLIGIYRWSIVLTCSV